MCVCVCGVCVCVCVWCVCKFYKKINNIGELRERERERERGGDKRLIIMGN